MKDLILTIFGAIAGFTFLIFWSLIQILPLALAIVLAVYILRSCG